MRKVKANDLASGTMRLALHLSEAEASFLERMNPDTLGCVADPRLYKAEWDAFVKHPDSKPFRVTGVA
jgi:hypothetical protein